MTDVRTRLAGKRVLVVEDEYFIAKSLARDLRAAGAEVVGPAPSIADALALIGAEAIDAAVLDVNLRGEMAFPVADALADRNVAFVFSTGYDTGMIPQRHAGIKRYHKPAEPDALAEALFPSMT